MDDPNLTTSGDDRSDTAALLLASALHLEPTQIDPKSALGETEQWDSLAHMRLMLLLEKEIGKPLCTDQMMAIESYSDVVRFLGEQFGK